MTEGCQFSGGLIDGEDGDAVIAAIGTVEKLAAGVNADFGAGAVAFESLRQCGDGLDFSKSAVIRVEEKAVTVEAISLIT